MKIKSTKKVATAKVVTKNAAKPAAAAASGEGFVTLP